MHKDLLTNETQVHRKEYITNLTDKDKTLKAKRETTKLNPQTLTAGRKTDFQGNIKSIAFEG